ncbi:hypothetical protein QVD17_11487 [Tagetes erecta]|uniref:Uncharacterized protein n=1 Tax=Tagetes erecta TaxID=13708 RepID=A0AAD8KY31_TARER|nr:hypothetical protein QVD17_11487 [Tagetes erecta]
MSKIGAFDVSLRCNVTPLFVFVSLGGGSGHTSLSRDMVLVSPCFSLSHKVWSSPHLVSFLVSSPSRCTWYGPPHTLSSLSELLSEVLSSSTSIPTPPPSASNDLKKKSC